ncbi:MAG: OmpA family protein, partial [bacterium]
GSPPGLPTVMPGQEVLAIAGPALAALPKPPARFILYFEHDSVDLTVESQALLPKVLGAIRDRAPVDVSVVGHTDTVGKKEYNYGLSLKRARAVASILRGKGVDPSVLDIASHGEENPLVPTGDQVSEPRNRRVEITVR